MHTTLLVLVTLACVSFGAVVELRKPNGELRVSNALVNATKLVNRRRRESLVRDTRKRSIPTDDRMAALAAHNEYRKKVSPSASNMQSMKWNNDLEDMAQEWADKCNLEHGQPSRTTTPYTSIGQNLWVHTANNNIGVAVKDWYDEVQFYNLSTNTCKEKEVCGHYTQVVWASSIAVGCGIANCKKITGFKDRAGYYVVCNYGPAGNWQGEKPYKAGPQCTSCPNPWRCITENTLCEPPETTNTTTTTTTTATSPTGDTTATSPTGDSTATSPTGDSTATSPTGDTTATSPTGDTTATSPTGDTTATSPTGDTTATSPTGDCTATSSTDKSTATSLTDTSPTSSPTDTSPTASPTVARPTASPTDTSPTSSRTDTSPMSSTTNTTTKSSTTDKSTTTSTTDSSTRTVSESSDYFGFEMSFVLPDQKFDPLLADSKSDIYKELQRTIIELIMQMANSKSTKVYAVRNMKFAKGSIVVQFELVTSNKATMDDVRDILQAMAANSSTPLAIEEKSISVAEPVGVSSVEEHVDPCISHPCQNGGNCIDLTTRYKCACPTGISGTHCEKSATKMNGWPCIGGRCLITELEKLRHKLNNQSDYTVRAAFIIVCIVLIMVLVALVCLVIAKCNAGEQ